jgi:hypothetical protein
MLLPPGQKSRLLAAVLRITVATKRPGRGCQAIAESLSTSVTKLSTPGTYPVSP